MTARGDGGGAIEEAAADQLGIGRRDRPLIFRETAQAAVDNGLAYWLVLVLSGAIATLGLALDNAGVVIGAMLVAPLLAPIVGLSLALAVGDARLALQCAVIIGTSLLVVIATAALLTILLPFQSLTLQISSRIRPTTLDLGVAVCSGLVGAVVTVARGTRLSAAIPGVAIAVALIPPLAVAGFGVATDWQGDIIRGALLLLGANLAGIVLSGVAVFLVIGMHRRAVVEAARRWHARVTPNGVAALACRLPGARRAVVFGSVTGRALLVLAFVAVLAVPLSETLREVVREARVRNAVATAIELLEGGDATSVTWHDVELDDSTALARVRVATSVGVSAAASARFRERAAELAGEPVDLHLEQLPATAGSSPALLALLRGSRRPEEGTVSWPETVQRARALLEQAAWTLPFPGGAEALAVALHVGATAEQGDSVEIAYLAPRPLDAQAADVLGVALRRAVGHAALRTSFLHAGPATFAVGERGSAAFDSIASIARRYPDLHVSVHSHVADSAVSSLVTAALRSAGVQAIDWEARPDPGPVELRLRRRPRPPVRSRG